MNIDAVPSDTVKYKSSKGEMVYIREKIMPLYKYKYTTDNIAIPNKLRQTCCKTDNCTGAGYLCVYLTTGKAKHKLQSNVL